MLRNSFHDALRSLWRAPGFALLTIAILAIGVGLNTAIFTVVDCVLLRPLGYHDADRIISVQTHNLHSGRTFPRVGGGDYVDLSQQVHGIQSAFYYQNWDGGVQVRGQSIITPLTYVSPRFGEVMGVQPVAGRMFGSNDVKGSEALVSAAFAREHFGNAGTALGQPLHGEYGQFTIVGVLPDGFTFPAKTAVWLESNAEPLVLARSAYNQRAIAKRRTGTSPAQLTAELATFSKRLQQLYPEDREKMLEAISLQESIVGKVASTLHLLMGSVAILLLIVCANITHLQLIRTTRQIREIAVRSALGASRARLAFRALAEAALLSVAGGAGALLLAVPALQLLTHLAPAGLPRLAEIGLNWHVLLYSLLISFALMALTALLPVWRSWRVDQSLVLRQDSARGLEGRSAVRLRSAFLMAQVAFTLVLAATAVLLARQLIAHTREDLGFDMERLYTLDASVIAPTASQPASTATTPGAKAAAAALEENTKATRLATLNSALETLRSTPGVIAAEAINGAPLGFGGSNVGYAIKGRSLFLAGANLPNAEMKPISPGALGALHVPLLRGRAFNSGDRAGTVPVVLVSKELADRVFPGEDAVGHAIMCGYDNTAGWWSIVGVVGSLKDAPGSMPEQTMYVPIAQHASRASSMQVLVRTAPGAQLSEEALRQRLQQARPDMAATATSMAQNLSEVERDLRFKSILFESFAGVSILLAMLGMYGATAYSVTQRTFEFGLRMALGSTRHQVVFGVMRRALWLAISGAAAGLVLYILLLRVSASVIGKLPSDVPSLLLAILGVVALTLLASAIPARRASTIDPARALHSN